ncbi:hypothetical protein HPB49_009534 [Dermacentor silvarum]|uniref:Uncharacterized protein n=1 Tax=Dermacentor silvarum TaxID=543639 RepID=A0ACB8DY51_DERSI|nr:hypothetical protein HPB49_009534 [Dermacentor silvarum]
MGPWNGRLRDSGAHLVGNYPNECPSVNQLFSNLRCVGSILGHRRVDLDKPCSASSDEGCFHIAQLSLSNNLLWVINIELREGRLALGCLRGRVAPLACNMQRSASFILIHWPLMQHRSIEFVELRESRRRPKDSRDGLELSGNLRHVTLCYHLLDYPPRVVDGCAPLCTDHARHAGDRERVLLERGCERAVRSARQVRRHVHACLPRELDRRARGSGADAMMCRAPLQRQIHVDELFATIDRCSVLADLATCTEVVEEPVVNR